MSGQTDVSIFDGKPKHIVVNGYSTSFRWPGMLQRKLHRYFGGDSPVTVEKAVRERTPIAEWMDIETGEPKQPWRDIVRPTLAKLNGHPLIVLSQQTLQYAFGAESECIRGLEDEERICHGADILEMYARLLQMDGADLVIIAVHIYKHAMEPGIGNEKYALEKLMTRNLPRVERGPDLWSATKAHYPQAFAEDRQHPNIKGAEIMAHHWFEALFRRENLDAPAWSREEMEAALTTP